MPQNIRDIKNYTHIINTSLAIKLYILTCTGVLYCPLVLQQETKNPGISNY